MEKSVGLVVYRLADGRRFYLLLHYPGGHWDFVKGHIEPGETELDTAARELLEETGLGDPDIQEDFRRTIRYFFRRGGRVVSKQVVVYPARVASAEVRLSHEHHAFAWLEYDEAMSELTFANSRNVLREAHKMLEGKAQSGDEGSLLHNI